LHKCIFPMHDKFLLIFKKKQNMVSAEKLKILLETVLIFNMLAVNRQ
jgi:hypothetical protein